MPRFPPGVHLTGGRKAAATHARNAREFYAPIVPIVAELRRQGLSLRAIARELDRRGVKTRVAYADQRRWSATQIRRVLARAAENEQADTPPSRPAIHPEASENTATHQDAAAPS